MILEFFYSLSIPLKETSLVFKALFSAVAKSFDHCFAYALEQIKGAFPRFTSNTSSQPSSSIKGQPSLYLWAYERNVVRIKGESEKDYSKRVTAAFAFLSSSMTKKGIESLVKKFTNKHFEIRELFTENWILGDSKEVLGQSTILGGARQAYMFVVEFSKLTVDEKNYISEIIELYKPAHTAFRVEAQILDDWRLGEESELLGLNTYL